MCRTTLFLQLSCYQQKKVLSSKRVSDKTIGQFLRYAFTSRYKEILSKSHSSSTTTVPKFTPRLTKEEARVFDSARELMTAFKEWRVGGARLQKASILGRKRTTKLTDGPAP